MKLTKLGQILNDRKLSPEELAKLTGGDISNMSIRRAIAGSSVRQLTAKAISKALKMKLADLYDPSKEVK